MLHHATLFLALLLSPRPAGVSEGSDTTRICLAPASVESSVGDASTASAALRDLFTSFLAGPSLRAQPLTARLASQVHEEAQQASCPYLLLTTLKHEHKRSGGGLLGRMATGAAQQGVWEAGVGSKTAAGRIAGEAAYGAASQAAYTYANSVHNKDEVTLAYRLEQGDGKALLDKSDKRKAKMDGEDLLTPMVQQAAEAVVAAVGQRP
jgi:hypothetical protein